MRGVGIRVKQSDRDRLRAPAGDGAKRPAHRGAGERQPALAARPETLLDSDATAPRDQWLEPSWSQRIERRAILASDLEQVLEASRRQQHHPGAGALEQRVGGDGRAMADQGAARGTKTPEPGDHGTIGSARRGGKLEYVDAGGTQRHEIGERPSRVDPDDARARGDGGGLAGLPPA